MSLNSIENGVAKEFKYLFGGVGYVAKTVDRLYGRVNGVDKIIFNPFSLDDIQRLDLVLYSAKGYTVSTAGSMSAATTLNSANISDYATLNIPFSGSGASLSITTLPNKVIEVCFHIFATSKNGLKWEFPFLISEGFRPTTSLSINSKYTVTNTVASGAWTIWRTIKTNTTDGYGATASITTSLTTHTFPSFLMKANYNDPFVVTFGSGPKNSAQQRYVQFDMSINSMTVNGKTVPMYFLRDRI